MSTVCTDQKLIVLTRLIKLQAQWSAPSALCTLPSSSAGGVYAAEGWGNVTSASFDEFRFWKVARDAQQIGRNWRASWWRH